MNSQINILIYLRDTYGRIESDPIYDFNGYRRYEQGREAAIRAVNDYKLGSKHFLRTTNLYGYLDRTINERCNDIITIVIPNLRNVYFNNRQRLSEEERRKLTVAVQEPLPKFKSIYDYPDLEILATEAHVPEYQVYGDITKYDVLHLPVRLFVEQINKREPLIFILKDVNVKISLSITPDDFWDNEYHRLITNVRIPMSCKYNI
jgi:hypothetical protein